MVPIGYGILLIRNGEAGERTPVRRILRPSYWSNLVSLSHLHARGLPVREGKAVDGIHAPDWREAGSCVIHRPVRECDGAAWLCGADRDRYRPSRNHADYPRGTILLAEKERDTA
jgi:hypothetical protein